MSDAVVWGLMITAILAFGGFCMWLGKRIERGRILEAKDEQVGKQLQESSKVAQEYLSYAEWSLSKTVPSIEGYLRYREYIDLLKQREKQ